MRLLPALLALIALQAEAAPDLATGAASGAATAATAATRPFTAKDLVMLDRVSEPRLAPDGRSLAFTLRETDFEGNRGMKSIWKLDLTEKPAHPQRLTAAGSDAWSARWSPDGRTLYFLSNRSGSDQVWSLAVGLGEARQVTRLPLDVGSYLLAPDGRRLALSLADVHGLRRSCLHQTAIRRRSASKVSGVAYDSLFVRHWDNWSDGTRSQLFIADLAADGTVAAEPRLVTRGIDGDVPSKPDGDESEYAFAPDGNTVYFGVRIAGTSEPWSTNFDLYAVPADGHAPPRNLTAGNKAWDAYPTPSADGTQALLPGHEATRARVRSLRHHGARSCLGRQARDRSELGPQRRAAAALRRRQDSLHDGRRPRRASAVCRRYRDRPRRARGRGRQRERLFACRHGRWCSRSSHSSRPRICTSSEPGTEKRLTELNAARLKDVGFGDFEAFTFKGWNGETVHGYVVKPFGFAPGRKYPVAFLIHGGPQGSWLNDFHYRWNPQTYAGAGFAVVEIDFHGSTGYGQAFTDAISGHWGDRPLEDLQGRLGCGAREISIPRRGPRLCARRKLRRLHDQLDRRQLAGAAIRSLAMPGQPRWCLRQPDDVLLHRGTVVRGSRSRAARRGNSRRTSSASIRRFMSADWKVPMLVIHSAKDYRIPLEQGLGAFTALQRRGVPSRFLTFPGRESLGAEAAEQPRVAPDRRGVAQEMDESLAQARAQRRSHRRFAAVSSVDAIPSAGFL